MQVTHRRQQTDYYCGPAVLQMVGTAFDKNITQHEAAQLAQTTVETGTSAENLVQALEHLGLTVRAGNNQSIADIKAAQAAGEIIIICFTERSYNWGHYAVVDTITDTHVSLIDPAESQQDHTPFIIQEFEKHWKDPLFTKTDHWAAFVSKPKE
jgi:ABC-type bacteriocin/lantibiotic exporter with double-glycine peptidase domain